MNRLSPVSQILRQRHARAAAWLALAAGLALPVAALAQAATGNDEAGEALHNIQSNFARMTPPPRTVDSINQELKQGEASAHAAGRRGRGGGRHGGRAAQDGTPPANKDQADVDAPAPAH